MYLLIGSLAFNLNWFENFFSVKLILQESVFI